MGQLLHLREQKLGEKNFAKDERVFLWKKGSSGVHLGGDWLGGRRGAQPRRRRADLPAALTAQN